MSHGRRLGLVTGLALLAGCMAAGRVEARLLVARSFAIGQFGDGAEDFRYPIGLSLVDETRFFVSDWKTNRVSLFHVNGSLLRDLEPEGKPFEGPLGLARDASGNLYVVENRAHRIRKFDPSGVELLAVGKAGAAPGQFRYPRGIAVDLQGGIFVADYGNRRIQRFDPSGVPVEMLEYRPEGPDKPAAKPRSVALDPSGRLWATFTAENRIVRFAPGGAVELEFGTKGSARGKLDGPRFLDFDVRGNLYVTDYENHRIAKFDDQGRFLYSFGARGSAPGQFHHPEGIAIDERGYVYVADTVNFRVQILEMNVLDFRLNLALAARRRGRSDEALEHYRWVLKRYPGDRESLAAAEEILLADATRAEAEGNLERALAVHESILELVPGHLESHRTIRRLFWLRSLPFLQWLGLGVGMAATALLLLVLLATALREEVRTFARRRRERLSETGGDEGVRPATLRDFAPRIRSQSDEPGIPPGAGSGSGTEPPPPPTT